MLATASSVHIYHDVFLGIAVAILYIVNFSHSLFLFRMCSPVLYFFFFSSRRRHTRFDCDWSSDVCSSDLGSTRVTSTCLPSTPFLILHFVVSPRHCESLMRFLISHQTTWTPS